MTNITNNHKLSFDLEGINEGEDYMLDPRPITSVMKNFFKTSQLSLWIN